MIQQHYEKHFSESETACCESSLPRLPRTGSTSPYLIAMRWIASANPKSSTMHSSPNKGVPNSPTRQRQGSASPQGSKQTQRDPFWHASLDSSPPGNYTPGLSFNHSKSKEVLIMHRTYTRNQEGPHHLLRT